MLNKRIFWTLLITGVIVTCTPVTQAKSTDRKPWPSVATVNNPGAGQAAERAPVAELETASQENRTGGQGGILDIIEQLKERQKTAIVDAWLGTASNGKKIILTVNADGTCHFSIQTEVNIDVQVGVHTPIHGVWQYLGSRQFGLTGLGIRYDLNTGQLKGFLKGRMLLTLNEVGDELISTNNVQLLDPNENVVFTLPPGNTTFKRIKFEPFN